MKKILLFFGIILTLTIGVCGEIFAVDEIDTEAGRPEIYIKAVNPGYTKDDKANVGEMIEISRINSDTPISLAGFFLRYINSSGNSAILFEFPEQSWMTGETILLRLASSPGSELADLNYTKTLAMAAGPLELVKGEEVIDAVCWTGKGDCLKSFNVANPTTLVRNLETFEFEHAAEYVPSYNIDNSGYYEEKKPEEVLPEQCVGLKFSEILSYYETSKSEQFIEFYNDTTEAIKLDGCKIKYKNKFYELSGMIQPENYFVRLLPDFTLTKNPTTENELVLIDADGTVVDVLIYKNGQKKATAYAWVGYDANGEELWKITYHPTPGEENIYQEYKTCEVGKVINTATGNCVRVAEEDEKVCEEGKYLNPLTNRCKAYEVTTEKVCDEGYYLNPETNRCKKIKDNDGAEYALDYKQNEGKSAFIALYAVIGVVVLGVGYAIFQFRHEIKKFLIKFFDKVFRRSH